MTLDKEVGTLTWPINLTLVIALVIIAPGVAAAQVAADHDGDGIEDGRDNCPDIRREKRQRASTGGQA